MIIAVIWILTGLSLLLWSLTAWGLHALLTSDPQWVDDFGALIAQVPFGDWIARWVPAWPEMLDAAVELTQHVVGWIGEAAPFIVWVAWGVGALLLLGGASLLTVLVSALRRRPSAAA
jgi:hypothetical protein